MENFCLMCSLCVHTIAMCSYNCYQWIVLNGLHVFIYDLFFLCNVGHGCILIFLKWFYFLIMIKMFHFIYIFYCFYVRLYFSKGVFFLRNEDSLNKDFIKEISLIKCKWRYFIVYFSALPYRSPENTVFVLVILYVFPQVRQTVFSSDFSTKNFG